MMNVVGNVYCGEFMVFFLYVFCNVKEIVFVY